MKKVAVRNYVSFRGGQVGQAAVLECRLCWSRRVFDGAGDVYGRREIASRKTQQRAMRKHNRRLANLNKTKKVEYRQGHTAPRLMPNFMLGVKDVVLLGITGPPYMWLVSLGSNWVGYTCSGRFLARPRRELKSCGAIVAPSCSDGNGSSLVSLVYETCIVQ